MAEPGRKRHIRAGSDSDTKHHTFWALLQISHTLSPSVFSAEVKSQSARRPRVSGPSPIQRLYLLNRCFWPRCSGVCFHYQIYSCTDYHEKTANPIHLLVTSFPALNLPSGVAQHLGFWFRSPILFFHIPILFTLNCFSLYSLGLRIFNTGICLSP